MALTDLYAEEQRQITVTTSDRVLTDNQLRDAIVLRLNYGYGYLELPDPIFGDIFGNEYLLGPKVLTNDQRELLLSHGFEITDSYLGEIRINWVHNEKDVYGRYQTPSAFVYAALGNLYAEELRVRVESNSPRIISNDQLEDAIINRVENGYGHLELPDPVFGNDATYTHLVGPKSLTEEQVGILRARGFRIERDPGRVYIYWLYKEENWRKPEFSSYPSQCDFKPTVDALCDLGSFLKNWRRLYLKGSWALDTPSYIAFRDCPIGEDYWRDYYLYPYFCQNLSWEPCDNELIFAHYVQQTGDNIFGGICAGSFDVAWSLDATANLYARQILGAASPNEPMENPLFEAFPYDAINWNEFEQTYFLSDELLLDDDPRITPHFNSGDIFVGYESAHSNYNYPASLWHGQDVDQEVPILHRIRMVPPKYVQDQIGGTVTQAVFNFMGDKITGAPPFTPTSDQLVADFYASGGYYVKNPIENLAFNTPLGAHFNYDDTTTCDWGTVISSSRTKDYPYVEKSRGTHQHLVLGVARNVSEEFHGVIVSSWGYAFVLWDAEDALSVGSLLVPSTTLDGHAEVSTSPLPGTCFAKSMESLPANPGHPEKILCQLMTAGGGASTFPLYDIDDIYNNCAFGTYVATIDTATPFTFMRPAASGDGIIFAVNQDVVNRFRMVIQTGTAYGIFNCDVIPGTDGTWDLGSNYYGWHDIWMANDTAGGDYLNIWQSYHIPPATVETSRLRFADRNTLQNACGVGSAFFSHAFHFMGSSFVGAPPYDPQGDQLVIDNVGLGQDPFLTPISGLWIYVDTTYNVVPGDVVMIPVGTTFPNVAKSQGAAISRVIGVSRSGANVSSGCGIMVAHWGFDWVLCDSAAVAVGNILITSATPGMATPFNPATFIPGTGFAKALDNKAAGSSGLVFCQLSTW